MRDTAYEPVEGRQPGTVYEIPDYELLRRAVVTARAKRYGHIKHERWVGVMDRFLLGSTYAKQLCRRFDLDPFEEVTSKR